MRVRSFRPAVLVMLAALSYSVEAQPLSQPLAVAPRPDRTTAAYGDWVLRCDLQVASGERACEVAQTVQDQRGQTLASLVLRRLAPEGRISVMIQVGASATVSEPLRLGVEDQPGLVLPFSRCLPRGCFAETEPAGAELANLARRTELVRIVLRDGEGQAIAIPVSLRGLPAALDALQATETAGAN